jgi:hypothetical protein
LLYEYALIGDHIVLLGILFLLNTRKIYPYWIIISVGLLFVLQVFLILLFPETIALFSSPARNLLHLFLINFIYAVFWALWFYFVMIKKDIAQASLAQYEKKLTRYGSLLVISNLVICDLLLIHTYISFFNFNFFYTISVAIPPILNFSLLYKIIGGVFLLHSYFFFRIIFYRSMRLLRFYGMSFFLLLILISLQWINHTAVFLGWDDALATFLKLFSQSYGYVGIVMVVLFGIALFTNFAALIHHTLGNYLSDSGRYKNHPLYLIKCGYLSIFILVLIVIFPLFI